MAQAQGSITIVDLLDTATYIYYANNKDGIDASFSPREDSEYIGIYNGPALPDGQPVEPPPGTNWLKSKGDPGEQGVGIKKTEITYSVNNSQTAHPTNGWIETIPQATISSPFLWTKTTIYYTNSTSSTSYSVSKIYNKNDEGIIIRTNQEEILKFKILRKDLENGYYKDYEFSPPIISYKVFQKEGNKEKQIEPFYQIYINTIEVTNLTAKINSEITLNLDLLVREKEQENTQQEQAILGIVKNQAPFTILIKIKEKDQPDSLVLAQKALICRYGLTEEGAQLNIHANGITQSIQENKLEFNGNGLSIHNGGLKIFNDKIADPNKKLSLYIDNDGNLNMKGIVIASSGVFNGEVNATSGNFTGNVYAKGGSFAGKLEAQSGKIAGFEISDSQLKSTAKVGKDSALILNGITGKIVANNIELGEGAIIRNFIKLGNTVELRYARDNSSPFLIAKNEQSQQETLSFNANGSIIIGGNNYIKIDGQQGSIYSKNYSLGQGWKLSNDETILNNVIVKGSIKSSVLEYGKVQAVGGILLIRPSSQIINSFYQEGTANLPLQDGIITVETNANFFGGFSTFQVGDYCQIGDYKVKILAVQGKKIGLQILDSIVDKTKAFKDFINQPIIDFGKEGSVGIAINATEHDSFTPPQSLTVFDYSLEKGILPHVILGKLPKDESFGEAQGRYGLYAENVVLKGSLSTYTEKEKCYSGISTIFNDNAPTSKTQFDKISKASFDSGEILIWAGAEDATKKGIENSKFFVDRNGNLFAKSGYFEGTIITNARISASELETATIIGSNTGTAALVIKDTKNGILFTNDQQKEVFKISDEETIIDTQKISLNKNIQVDSTGTLLLEKIDILDDLRADSLTSQSSKIKKLTLEKNKISYLQSEKNNQSLSDSLSYIDFASGVELSGDGKTSFITCDANKIICKKNIQIDQNIVFDGNMEYRRVYEENQSKKIIGYDLFIN